MERRGRGRPRKRVSGNGAEFFKVFLPDISSHQLMISPDFIKDFKRTVSEKVRLRDVGGTEWYVDVKNTPDGVFLKNTWQSYVDYHCLKVGEFLVFRYDRCYSFMVKIFGTNGCKRKKALHNAKIEEESEEEKIEEKLTSHKRPHPHKEDQLLTENGRTEHSEKLGVRSGEVKELQEQNVESKNAEGVLSECPYFISHVGSSRKLKLRIPDEVISKHNLKLEPEMILRNENGKEWTVRVFNICDAKLFGSGWKAFQIDNNVWNNDSCKFTFDTERFSRTISVQILRSGPDSSHKMLKHGRGRPKKIASDNLVQKMVNSSDEKKAPYSDELPEFFKVYVPSMSSETVRIPPDFIEVFGGNIPKNCTLENSSGLSWNVDMKRISDHWFFQKGWPEFVQDNSLQDRDFLTFAYARNSTFYVKVYSGNGCIKIAENIDDATTETEDLQENETFQHFHSENPKNNKDVRRSSRLESSKEVRESVDRNPSFSLVIGKTYLRNEYLTVPIKFWKLYLREDEEESRMVTLWIKNNKWIMSLMVLGDRVILVNDCSRFFRDNSLKIGNSCTFQLIDSDNLAFKVTVRR